MLQKIVNAFRPARVNREIDEELRAHLDEAHEAGRDETEARRALGSPLKLRDEMHDARVLTWLDSLRADAVYGWRRLARSKITTAAAILSLGLAIGACTAAFRLADALLWRPLPVAAPHEIYELDTVGVDLSGKPEIGNHWSYPLFTALRAAAKEDVDLVANSSTTPSDVKYGSNADPERAYVQYVSGAMFSSFGLRPAAGRLIMPSDDDVAGAHAYAVLSYQYWRRRFAHDPRVVGASFQFGGQSYEIIGVVAPPYTGTEPGTMTDIFLPATMSPYANATRILSFLHIFARIPARTAIEPTRDKLQSVAHAAFVEQLRQMPGLPGRTKEAFLNRNLVFADSPTGSSTFQEGNRRTLVALFILSLVVLLIACTNVANLATAQTAARRGELALRVSIGGGRRRLVQLVLVESAMIGIAAALFGSAFSWWAAPRVVSMINPPDNPVRLALPADWRVLGFLVAATSLVTMLFGLAPALRAAGVDPASALRGGEDRHTRRGTLHGLIAVQVGFSVFVVFTAGLFVMTFERLTHKPTGFAADRVLAISASSAQSVHTSAWENALKDLERQPGVAAAAYAGWPLLEGTNAAIGVGLPGAPKSDSFTRILRVSPGWAATMRVPILSGRDFSWTDSNPGAALVSQSFAKTFFGDADPVGKTFVFLDTDVNPPPIQIVGVLKDVCHTDLRECGVPTAYIPLHEAESANASGAGGTWFGAFIVRTESENPLALAQALRRELARVAPELHVTRIRTQREIDDAQTIHERLLSTLATFFAVVALLLAGIGLYGVLNYSVVRRQREIGIRIAVGAQPANIARTVIATAFAMVIGGVAAGLVAGAFAVRPLQALFYEVKPTDASALALPAALILAAAALAAIPAVIRAVRIDPVILLRSE